MDLSGEYRIAAGREAVWAALNDADVLRQCIPGCKELEKHSDTEMSATVVAKVGPVKATFKGAVTLEDLNPPESYRIVGEGKGGVAGFAKGGAEVHLTEDGDETVLTYDVKAQVGGKLAQLGSRLIASTARKMADEFFGTFKGIVEDGGAAAAPSAAAMAGDGPDAGVIEEAKTIALDHAPEAVVEAAEAVETRIEKAVHDVEVEVEAAAGRGVLGGPMVWGLIALAGVIVVLALMG
ncbi:SRPBCC family protein [Stappia indica]|uniref:SRPBCC family protein n=1 Tax=Stappia indica TaxID=538381 RepID=UPI001CD57E3C|nr:carbon monoxide dehydrogenase subunit G [Stappia indica]MCA1299220.1 carbon monoxide dehydrogenase subunit G [Stappia indica]